jgi:flagellar FliJ protein
MALRMSTTFPLQTLLELTQTRTDEAARRLGELLAAERSVADKLRMLEDYRQEYNARFVAAAQAGLSPDAWRNYTAFIARLDEAIIAQHSIVTQSQHQTAQGQQAWLKQRNRLMAFDTLAERHRQQLARAEARQEQKQADEHATRRRHAED